MTETGKEVSERTRAISDSLGKRYGLKIFKIIIIIMLYMENRNEAYWFHNTREAQVKKC